MMKLFEKTTTPAAGDLREHHGKLPDLPEGVSVPDDLSGLPATDLVDMPDGHRPVRWMRWVPVGLLLAAGGVTLALVLDDGGTNLTKDIVTNEVVVDGPGSNSMDVQVVVEPEPEEIVDGPGSNSMNVETN